MLHMNTHMNTHVNHFESLCYACYKMFTYLLTLFAISTEIFCLLCVCVVCIPGCLCLWILYTLTAGIVTHSHSHTVSQSLVQSASRSQSVPQSLILWPQKNIFTRHLLHVLVVADVVAAPPPCAPPLLLLLSLISGCMICWQWPQTATTVEEETEVHRQLKYFFVARW